MLFKATEETKRQRKIEKMLPFYIIFALIIAVIGIYYELLIKLKGKIGEKMKVLNSIYNITYIKVKKK